MEMQNVSAVNLLIRTWNRVNYRAGSRESWAEPPELLHQWHSLRLESSTEHRQVTWERWPRPTLLQQGQRDCQQEQIQAGDLGSSKRAGISCLIAESCEGMTKVDPTHHPGASSNTAGQTFCWRVFLTIRFLSEFCRLHSLEEEKSLQGQTLTQTIVCVWLTAMYFFVWN